MKVSLETSLNIKATNRDKWPDVFKRLRVQGFGDVYLRDKYLIIKAPFINNYEVWCGFLEGLLEVKLEAKTMSAPFVFEVLG